MLPASSSMSSTHRGEWTKKDLGYPMRDFRKFKVRRENERRRREESEASGTCSYSRS